MQFASGPAEAQELPTTCFFEQCTWSSVGIRVWVLLDSYKEDIISNGNFSSNHDEHLVVASPNFPLGVVTPLSSHSRRMENGEWRKLLVEGFIIFHLGLLLSHEIHTTKSA
jgi:hypothetical protein